jgi:hypothetical protein
MSTTTKAKIPRRFYRGQPRRLTAPKKSIRECGYCGTFFVGPGPLCPRRACARAVNELPFDLEAGRISIPEAK